MKKSNISKVLPSVRAFMAKHSPEILTGIGIVGMITTTVMAVRVTPKVLILIEERKGEIGAEELEVVDVVKITWFCYIPVVIAGILSIACLIGASSANTKRNVALTTAYTLSESAPEGYRGKVVKTSGRKKHEIVKDAVAKDEIERNPVVTGEVITTEGENTLCYDTIPGRYSKGDVNKIKKTECELDRQICDGVYVFLNDLYYEVGLDNIKTGDELGWNIDNGYIDLLSSSQLASDGTPRLVIDYGTAPRYNFSELM